jgi:hypothetical protein
LFGYNQPIVTLKMATEKSVETLDNS